MYRLALGVIAMAACRSPQLPVTGLTLARVFGGAAGADRWQGYRPRGVWLAPDGQRAILVGENTTALVASPSGAPIAAIPAHAGFTNGSVAFAPDSQRFAIVDMTRSCVAVWTVAPLAEQQCLAASRSSFVAFSPDSASLVVSGEGHLVRWSLASRAKAWDVAFGSSEAFIAWPSPAVILVGADHLAGYDAATGRAMWGQTSHVDHYLGMVQGEAVIVGNLGNGSLSGVVARLDPGSGALRDLTGDRNQRTGGGALLPDGTVVVVDDLSIARRYRLGGPELGRYLMPEDIFTIAQHAGVAIVAARQGIVLWDLRAGVPIAIDDMQPAAILALDADARGVVSAAADGSVVVRHVNGRLLERRHARALRCRAWAVSARARQAVCAADLEGFSGLAGLEAPSHEWIDLDDDRRGAADWFVGDAVALDDHGLIWGAAGSRAAWIDTQHPVVPDRSTRPGSPMDRFRPSVARIVNGGVAFGGVSYYMSPHGSDSGWYGEGLWLMNRQGEISVLDPKLYVVALGAAHTGDVLAVATLGEVELWRLAKTWTRQWSRPVDRLSYLSPPQRGGTTAIALSDDGALVATAEHNGRAVVLYNGVTGAMIGKLAVGNDVRFVTALAFTAHAIHAGTNTGVVLRLDLHRGP